MAYEFKLDEHNFQNQPGDRMLDMNEMSSNGWEVENSVIAFPYIHVLWKREIGAKPGNAAQAADHSNCTAELSRLSGIIAEHQSQREGAEALLVAARAHQVQLEGERDQARNVAREQQAARHTAEAERDQLRQQIIQLRQGQQPPAS